MKFSLSVILAVSILAPNLFAQLKPQAIRNANTYSIVAYDKENNLMGVAVQSHYFGVGAIVTWAEPGVGAVATQSIVDPSYGTLGLSLMEAGQIDKQTQKRPVAADKTPGGKQVALEESTGCSAHTRG